jgi:hypothetical protein
MGSVAHAACAVREARGAERCGDIGQAARRRGRPPHGGPEGRGLLRAGGVSRLDRGPTTLFAVFLARAQNASVRTGSK